MERRLFDFRQLSTHAPAPACARTRQLQFKDRYSRLAEPGSECKAANSGEFNQRSARERPVGV